VGIPLQTIKGIPVVAGALYRPPIDGALQRFKYGSRPDLAHVLADLVQPRLEVLAPNSATRFVPVPLHRSRLAQRGYDQACLLSARLADHWSARSLPRALERHLATRQQARLARSARQRNVEAAFAARDTGAVRGRRVILVDDVVTTGATALACARVLQQAGARISGIACVALADKCPAIAAPLLQDC